MRIFGGKIQNFQTDGIGMEKYKKNGACVF